MNGRDNTIFCYGFGLTPPLFEAIVFAVNLTPEKSNCYQVVENSSKNVDEIVRTIEIQSKKAILFASIFNTKMEAKTKELIVRLRLLKNIISKIPAIIFAFPWDNMDDPIFETDGCRIVRFPCKIDELIKAAEIEPISDQAKKTFLEFVQNHMLEIVQRKIRIFKHDYMKLTFFIKNVAEKESIDLNKTEREKFNAHVYDILSRLEGIVDLSNQLLVYAYPEIPKMIEVFTGIKSLSRNITQSRKSIISGLQKVECLLDKLKQRNYEPGS